jgi:hypothetical protein
MQAEYAPTALNEHLLFLEMTFRSCLIVNHFWCCSVFANRRLAAGRKTNRRITKVDKIILSQYDAIDRLEHGS